MWSLVQRSYIAGIDSLRAQRLSTVSSTVHAENYPLLLPSDICLQIPCSPVLLDREWKLREGQAHDALDGLRRHLRLRTYLLKYKGQHISGQGPTTRARATINNVQSKVDANAAHYRAAHAAMSSLAPFLGRSNWQGTLRRLEDGDIRAISDGEMFETEGHRTMSWIWKVTGVTTEDESDPTLHEGESFELYYHV